MIVPLVSRGHVARRPHARARATASPYTPADLGTTQELAGRAAAAVDQQPQVPARAARPHAASPASSTDSTRIVWEADPATLEITFVSHRAESLLGYPRAAWLDDAGVLDARLIHPDDREAALADAPRPRRGAAASAASSTAWSTADGRLVWIDNIVRPVRRDDGRVRHAARPDARHHRAQAPGRGARPAAGRRAGGARRRRGGRRSARASWPRPASCSSSSLDRGATLDSLVGLAVPAFADWCLVHLAEPVAGRRLHAAGADADGTRVAEAVERLATALELPALLPFLERMQAGEPLLVPEIGPAWLEGLQLLQQLAPKSVMVVPLVARGRTVGTLSFIATRPERRYGPADLALARDLAQRAAIAVDNARLYAGGRGRQPRQGPVPGHALARAAHAADGDARLGADAPLRPAERRRGRRRPWPASSATRACRPSSSTTCSTSRASWPASCRSTSGRSTCGWSSSTRSTRSGARPRRARHVVTCTIDPEAAWVAGRRRAARAGPGQPARQRRQVHARGRPHRRAARPSRRAGARDA